MNKKYLLILSIAICFLISCLAADIFKTSPQETNGISIPSQNTQKTNIPKPSQTALFPQSPYSIHFTSLESSNENGWTNYEGYYSITFQNEPFMGEEFPVTCFPSRLEGNDNEPLEYFFETHVRTEEGYTYPAYLDRFVIPYTWPEMGVLLAPGLPIEGEWLVPETREWAGRSHPILTDNPERAWSNGANSNYYYYRFTISFKIPESLHPETLVIPCLNSEIAIPDTGFSDIGLILPEGIVDPPEAYDRSDFNLNLQVGNFEYSYYSDSMISTVLVPIEIKNDDLTASFINLDETLFVTVIDDLGLIWKPVSCRSVVDRSNPSEIGPGQQELYQFCFVSKYGEYYGKPVFLWAIIGDVSDTMIFMDRDLSD